MDSASPKRHQTLLAFTGRAIEWGVIALIVFAPLAFASINEAARSVTEAWIFAITIIWLFRGLLLEELPLVGGLLPFFVLAFVLLIFVQTIPLPASLVSMLSPGAAKLGEAFGFSFATISINPGATWDELLRLLAALMLFMVVASYFTTKERIIRIAVAIVSIASICALIVALQKTFSVEGISGIYELAGAGDIDPHRVWGPYLNHSHFAGLMELAIPLAAGLILYRVTRIRFLPGTPLKRKLVRFFEDKSLLPMAFGLAAIVLMVGVLFMSLSRGGIISTLVALLFFTVAVTLGRTFKRRGLAVAASVVMVLLIVTFFSWSSLEERFGTLGEPLKLERINVWRDSSAIVAEYPLTGTGLGTFADVYPLYQSHYPTVFFSHAENEYVETAVELGIPGLFLALSILVLYFVQTLRQWAARRNTFVRCIAAGGMASCAAIAVHSLSDFNMRIPANLIIFSVVAALTYGALFNLKSRGAGSR